MRLGLRFARLGAESWEPIVHPGHEPRAAFFARPLHEQSAGARTGSSPGKPDGSGPAIRLNRRHHLFLSCTLALIAAIRFSSTQSIPVGLHPGGASVSVLRPLLGQTAVGDPTVVVRTTSTRLAAVLGSAPRHPCTALRARLHRPSPPTSAPDAGEMDGASAGVEPDHERSRRGSCGRGRKGTDPARSRSCPGHPRPTARRDRRSSTADHTDPDDPGSQRTGTPDPVRGSGGAPRRGTNDVDPTSWWRGPDSNRRPSAHEADELPLLHPDNGRCP